MVPSNDDNLWTGKARWHSGWVTKCSYESLQICWNNGCFNRQCRGTKANNGKGIRGYNQIIDHHFMWNTYAFFHILWRYRHQINTLTFSLLSSDTFAGITGQMTSWGNWCKIHQILWHHSRHEGTDDISGCAEWLSKLGRNLDRDPIVHAIVLLQLDDILVSSWFNTITFSLNYFTSDYHTARDTLQAVMEAPTEPIHMLRYKVYET